MRGQAQENVSVNQNNGDKAAFTSDPGIAIESFAATIVVVACNTTHWGLVSQLSQGIIADSFATKYSLAALSLGGSAMTPSPATEAQFRMEKMVARVPLAPLYALVASNFLLSILGLVLAVWAFSTVRGDVSEVQARPGVGSLVGSCFESEAAQRPVRHVEDIFGEKSGLGARKVEIFKTPLGREWVGGH
ncbi:hypothetical protein EV127DRAFT_483664 [Xylaria flabelliformis]|nr:hypothetical protein EV127DRAFT_483664 [Xylaria flabelliformis]